MSHWLIRIFINDAENTGDARVRNAYANLACVTGILCNVLLFAGKFAVGTLFGSVAIAADAMNNLSDASSNIVSLVGFRLGARPADEKHPFGHARYEYLAGLVVSVMILVIGIELLKESVTKVLHPTPVAFGWLSAVVLVASILIKLWMSLFNKKIGTLIDSKTLLATAADARNDVISTAAVLVASLAVVATGFTRLDGLAGVAVAAFILYSGVGLVRDTLDPILGAAPDPELIERLERKVMTYPNVLGIHDLMLHDYGPGNRLVSFHVEMPAGADVLQSHDTIDTIEKDLLREEGLIATIHYDPVVTDDAHVNELRSFLTETAARLEPDAAVHDLRIVPGTSHTNVVFDCAVPPDYLTGKNQRAGRLANALREAVREKWPDHFCVIRMESNYGAAKLKEASDLQTRG